MPSPTLTQSTVIKSTSVTTAYSGSFSSPPAAGSLVVVMAGGQLGIPGATSCTVADNQGNTYTQLVFEGSGSGANAVTIWACANVSSSGTFTVTVTFNHPQVHNNLVLEEWANMPSTLTTDGTSADFGNNSGGNQSCGTLTTSNADDLLFAFVINNGNNPLDETAPTGYTLDQSFLTSVGCAAAHKVANTTVSSMVNFTSTVNTGQWSGVTAALIHVAGPKDVNLTASMATMAGTLNRRTGKTLSASMSTFAGSLTANLILTKSFAAAMRTMSGSLAKVPGKSLVASMATFSGSLTAHLANSGKSFSASMATFSGSLGISGQVNHLTASMAPFSGRLSLVVQRGPVPPTCESAACDTTVQLISHIEVCEAPGS